MLQTSMSKSSELSALDLKHHLHPFSDMKVLQQHGVRVMTRGEGVHVFDADGNSYLDAFSGLWCVNVGYGPRDLQTRIGRQRNAGKLDIIQLADLDGIGCL